MAELTISTDEIRSAIESYVSSYTPEATREEVGIVAETGDGNRDGRGPAERDGQRAARVRGRHAGRRAEPGRARHRRGHPGDAVQDRGGPAGQRTGEVLSVPVGDATSVECRRAGQPDRRSGRGHHRDPSRTGTAGASVVQRQDVKEPLLTGIKAIDAMTAIGRGQRQLIIGDRQTGKTTVCLDTIINSVQLARRRPEEAGALYLRGHRAEGLDHRGRPPDPRRGRRDGIHDHRRCPGLGRRGLQVHRPLHRLGDRPALDV